MSASVYLYPAIPHTTNASQTHQTEQPTTTPVNPLHLLPLRFTLLPHFSHPVFVLPGAQLILFAGKGFGTSPLSSPVSDSESCVPLLSR